MSNNCDICKRTIGFQEFAFEGATRELGVTTCKYCNEPSYKVLLHPGDYFAKVYPYGPECVTKKEYHISTDINSDGYSNTWLNKEPFVTEAEARLALEDLDLVPWLDVDGLNLTIELSEPSIADMHHRLVAKEEYTITDFHNQYRENKEQTYTKVDTANRFLAQFNLTMKDILDSLPE